MSRLLSVNVGLPRDIAWHGETVRTSVWKEPVQDRRMVRRLNIDGDKLGDEWCSGQAKGGETMENQTIRTVLDRHWAASAAGDIEAEHEIYDDDVLVEYPQSGERIRGRHNIQALRGHHPAKLGFTIRRILGSGDLWITEYVLSYNEQPTQTVSIMEFRDGKVVHETQYFADPFEPPAWRAQWVERIE